MKKQKKMSVTAMVLAAALSLTMSGCDADFGDDIYVKWWTKGSLSGLFYLLDERDKLFSENLFSTYTDYPENVACDNIKARTIDGTCNDLEKTKMGSAGMRFGRNVPLTSSFPDQNLMEPNPRTISRELMGRLNGQTPEAGHLSYLAAAWIQFMVHDWFAHENDHTQFFKIPMSPDDPMYDPANPYMMVNKTKQDPSQDPGDGMAPAYQNRVTHWWDGSQIYGSDKATNDKIRTFKDGKLKTDSFGRLPIDPDTGVPLTGFSDNWWVGLAIFHQLFVMEHNSIADMLNTLHPFWNDQRIYDTARLINTAVMAKIHTVEWTPAILKNDILRDAMIGNWNGFKNIGYLLPWTGDPRISGIMGSAQEHFSAPFALTEEFTAVYRMHPLLRESLPIRSFETDAVQADVKLEDSAFAKATDLMNEHGLANMFYSFGRTKPGALTTNNYPKFLTEFEVPGMGGMKMDLAAVDILRDRERGVPRYNEFRRELGLNPIIDFSDISPDQELCEKLREVYGNDVEKIDTLIGQLAEGYRPPGYGFGETSFTIFIAMASRRLQSDRFYTDNYTVEYYTLAGMWWIEQAGINQLIKRHMPELAPKLDKVGNAFFPWQDDTSGW